MNFLDKFPKIQYDINKTQYSNFETVTDLTFRFSVIKDVLDNTAAYYKYAIKEGETPEILADRVYGDPEAYWMILYANDIYDPQYDWPMNSDVFEKFIIGKYGSINAAKTIVHHYEKILARQIDNSETILVDRETVDYNSATWLSCTIDNLTPNTSNMSVSQYVRQIDDTSFAFFSGVVTNLDLANNRVFLSITDGKMLDYYDLYDLSYNNLGRVINNTHRDQEFYLNLPSSPQYTTYTINNKRVTEGVSRQEVSCYDYELERNESKRLIKVIKKEYYGQIQQEFKTLTRSNPGFFRRLA